MQALRASRRGIAMASRMSDERTSFVAFARQHVFVTIFGLVLPVVLFLCFIGYPIVYTIYLSFFEWNGMAPVKKFVGFANYSYMLGDKYFYISLENNLKWLAVSLAFPVVLGFLIAYAMRAARGLFPDASANGDILSGDDVAGRGGTDVPPDPQPDFRRVRHRAARARPRAFWFVSGSATIASRSTRSRSSAGGRSPGCR